MATKNHIFEEHLSAWLKAKGNKEKRGEIINHICFVTKLHRKSVSRRFRKLQLRDPAAEEHRGRSVMYTPDVTAALKDVWEAADEICGELLHSVIAEYIDILIRDDLWTHDDEATGKLRAMSERTLKRRIARFEKTRGRRRGVSATSPSALKHIIPISKGPWKDVPPGYGQIDTVVHCGDTLLGDMAFTVNYTDAATYWIVPRAQWNKGSEATVESMKVIKERLPFRLRGIHPDTGSEFINWTAKRWCDEEKIVLTRSEPGKKNDNMYVEERNGHVVRKYLGYTRLDCRAVVPLMNELYDVLGLYLNHFIPVRRTLSKERVDAKYRRVYEKRAKTSYQRVLEHGTISKDVKARLRRVHKTLNPLLLKREIDTLRAQILKVQKRDRGPRRSSSSR
ncbi:MAG: hypothetical protein AAB562_01185 [Patescibacteria group bacterium]